MLHNGERSWQTTLLLLSSNLVCENLTIFTTLFPKLSTLISVSEGYTTYLGHDDTLSHFQGVNLGLFVNREGLMGDVMFGGCLGHSDHEIIRVFNLQRKKEEGQQNYHLRLPKCRLWLV